MVESNSTYYIDSISDFTMNLFQLDTVKFNLEQN